MPNEQDDPHSLRRRARRILERRRRRQEILGKSLFGEPAWEMLLLLYVRDTGHRQTIRGLTDLAELSKSTAVRWIDYLVARGLVDREAHPTDKRAAFVELSARGREILDLYLAGTTPALD